MGKKSFISSLLGRRAGNGNQQPSVNDTKSDKQVEHGKAKKGAKAATYNLIILDESGSMSCVRRQTISGCNETLNGIRNNAKTYGDLKQYVSIYCFDTVKSRYIFENVPIDDVRDLTPDDYSPNACTPLYDAIGETVSALRRLTVNSDIVGNVTIITDGMENASKKWKHSVVVELIDSLKAQGWVFTFIGANIDVESTAKDLGINSYMKFEQTDDGMRGMFESERRSRRAYSSKLHYMRDREFYSNADERKKKALLHSLNQSYFTEDGDHVAPDYINQLQPDEIFVFGSNIYGKHSGGASLYAVQHFGAVDGQAEGLQGQCYAIPVVGNSFEDTEAAVLRFTDFVVQHPGMKFMLSAVGCGNAGYRVDQIAHLFRQAYSFGNVYVPAAFIPYM